MSSTLATTRTVSRTWTTAVAVAMGHALTDVYASFLTPLLPRLMAKLGLSITLAATLAVSFNLASSLLQPVLGYVADHVGRRRFVTVGPLAAGVFLSLIGVAPSYAWLTAFLVLGGLGSAAFHPPGVSYAARVEAGGRSGLRVSLFSFAGAVGFAAGPLLVIWLVLRTGLEGMWVAMLPALVLMPIVYLVLPADPGIPAVRAGAAIPRRLWGPLAVVFGISALQAFAQRVFVTFSPIISADAGVSESLAAFALSAYLGGQAIGTLVGGYMSDRVHRGHLLIGLTVASVPAHALAVGLPPGSPLALGTAALAGLVGMAVLPPVVVMAQEMLPERTSSTSGIVMGLAWALASIGILVPGFLGDAMGARDGALAVLPVLVLGVLLAWRLVRADHPFLRA